MAQSLKSIASINVAAINNIVPTATGISITGNAEIGNAPTEPDHAARKDYVDSTSVAYAIALG